MKKYNTFITCLIFLTGLICCSQDKYSDTAIYTFNLSKNYPKKGATDIQNIANIKYVVLETNNDFLCDASDGIKYIDEDNIIFYNGTNGDFLIFSGTGKALKTFNRRGAGPEEYLWGVNSFFDKEKSELYIYCSSNKINVYDLSGIFKKQLSLPASLSSELSLNILDFDKNSFLCYTTEGSFLKLILISKHMGEKVKETTIEFAKKNIDYMQTEKMSNLIMSYFSREFRSDLNIFVKKDGGFYINSFASDTCLIQIDSAMHVTPVLFRKPHLRDKSFYSLLFAEVETPNYLFIRLNKQTFEFSSIPLSLDRRTGEISEQNFCNQDDLSKENIYFGLRPKDIKRTDRNNYYALYQSFELIETHKKGQLKGKLKEIASQITEDNNPVVMIVTLKSN